MKNENLDDFIELESKFVEEYENEKVKTSKNNLEYDTLIGIHLKLEKKLNQLKKYKNKIKEEKLNIEKEKKKILSLKAEIESNQIIFESSNLEKTKNLKIKYKNLLLKYQEEKLNWENEKKEYLKEIDILKNKNFNNENKRLTFINESSSSDEFIEIKPNFNVQIIKAPININNNFDINFKNLLYVNFDFQPGEIKKTKIKNELEIIYYENSNLKGKKYQNGTIEIKLDNFIYKFFNNGDISQEFFDNSQAYYYKEFDSIEYKNEFNEIFYKLSKKHKLLLIKENYQLIELKNDFVKIKQKLIF